MAGARVAPARRDPTRGAIHRCRCALERRVNTDGGKEIRPPLGAGCRGCCHRSILGQHDSVARSPRVTNPPRQVRRAPHTRPGPLLRGLGPQNRPGEDGRHRRGHSGGDLRRCSGGVAAHARNGAARERITRREARGSPGARQNHRSRRERWRRVSCAEPGLGHAHQGRWGGRARDGGTAVEPRDHRLCRVRLGVDEADP